MSDNPILEDLTPIIEAIHHACQCGAYDEANSIYMERINRGTFYITQKLGAWETELDIMREFFPGGDTSLEPLVSRSNDKSRILKEVGLCLKNIGRGNLADLFYERALAIDLESGDCANASVVYQNLSDLYCNRGNLAKSLQAADQALDLARRAEIKDYECDSLLYQAQAHHLQGDLDKASQHFREAKALKIENDPSKSYLYGSSGIQHADHLRRRGEADYALKVTQANLEICEINHWPNSISSCHRILADLFSDAGQQEEARESYSRALDIARGIFHRLVLIEALLGRGRWYGKIMKDPDAASSDLTEALEYARAGGYRLYEADARVGLAWAHLATGDRAAARAEAEYARRMSQEMGYYWGGKDAEEVLAEIDKQESRLD